jgi:hypothetical protein
VDMDRYSIWSHRLAVVDKELTEYNVLSGMVVHTRICRQKSDVDLDCMEVRLHIYEFQDLISDQVDKVHTLFVSLLSLSL